MKYPAINHITFGFTLSLLMACNSCNNTTDKGGGPGPHPQEVQATVPTFNADSAYTYVDKQVSFGPRMPNTKEHDDCGKWLETEFRKYADQVTLQTGKVKAFDGKNLNFTNIIASFNPKNANRILLSAHWDTRPWADHDADEANHKKPILGANDAASGAGVLLEIARVMKENKIDLGVDIVLFDIEDYGQPENSGFPELQNTYGLGSQYWAKNPHVAGYQAKWGILLDMVGGKNTTFRYEGNSMQFAPDLTKRIWAIAADKGYGNNFVPELSQPIQDDHYYVNIYAGIPTVDIIHLDNGATGKLFHPVWHTMQDNMENIDKNTLKATGQTLLELIYREDKGAI